MPSRSTRYEIVQRALTLAGRDVRLRNEAAEWLNDLLDAWALEYKYPQLRKVGDAIVLPTGSSSVAGPLDMGAGTDNLLFGAERLPLYEKNMDEFVQMGGLTSQSTGRPSFYTYDKQANLFRFNSIADQNYDFIPIYYYRPARIAISDAGDAMTVWMENDKLVIEGLIESIYQYTGDVREGQQAQKVIALRNAYRQGVVPLGGGVNKVMLSRTAFKTRRWR